MITTSATKMVLLVLGMLASTQATCTSPIDIVMLLDASGSMFWRAKGVRAFARAVLDSMELGVNAGRMGVVFYETDATIISQLSTDRAALNAGIGTLYTDGLTHMSQGLEYALDVVKVNDNVSPDGWIRHKVIMLVTDGIQNPQFGGDKAAIASAQAVKAAGVTLYAFGIGSDVRQQTLDMMASTPSDVYAQQFDTTASLLGLIDGICDTVSGPSPPPPPSTPITPTSWPSVCTDECQFASNGSCDDGSTGSTGFTCKLGTDCTDCGSREAKPQPPPPPPPPSPPAPPSPSTTVEGDPHLRGAHSDRTDFKGKNNTIYALHSSRHLAANVLFVHDTFMLGAPCLTCHPKKVHGSVMSEAFISAKTSKNQTVHVSMRATAPSRAKLSIFASPDANPTESEVKVSTMMPDVKIERLDDLRIELVRKHARETRLTVSNGEFALEAKTRFYPWANVNQRKRRLDISIRPLVDINKSPVAPHGLVGQTWDRDEVAIDGARDDYSSSEVFTKAMGEGAIEGVAADYEIPCDQPFSENFKFSRYNALRAAPRDVSKLSGVRRSIKLNGIQTASSESIAEEVERSVTEPGTEVAQ